MNILLLSLCFITASFPKEIPIFQVEELVPSQPWSGVNPKEPPILMDLATTGSKWVIIKKFIQTNGKSYVAITVPPLILPDTTHRASTLQLEQNEDSSLNLVQTQIRIKGMLGAQIMMLGPTRLIFVKKSDFPKPVGPKTQIHYRVEKK